MTSAVGLVILFGKNPRILAERSTSFTVVTLESSKLVAVRRVLLELFTRVQIATVVAIIVITPKITERNTRFWFGVLECNFSFNEMCGFGAGVTLDGVGGWLGDWIGWLAWVNC